MAGDHHGEARVMLPVICIFGGPPEGIQLYSDAEVPEFETRELDCRCFADDADLEGILIEHRPHVIVSFGEEKQFPNLMAAPFEVRRRWLNFEAPSDLARIGWMVFQCYLGVCLDQRKEEPLVSVITPTYNTGQRILRPLISLRNQSYRNWEWIVWDDSNGDARTADLVQAVAKVDHRIELIKPSRHSGIIGEVKNKAFTLSRGAILVELDHDDELTSNALGAVVDAFRKYPKAGFFYTDCAEVDADRNSLTYPKGWGFGLGSYRTEIYEGREYAVASTEISPKTIRHIVAAPNHIRAWRRDTYFEIGGHNREIHVADDYEIMVRTFLATRMCHIPRFGYIQYMDNGRNTQRLRNPDIQRHVRYLRNKYDLRIHERFVELAVDDYVWDRERGVADFNRPNPDPVQTASITAEV